VTQPLTDWDGRMTWVVKARYLRQAGTVDAEVLRNGQWFVSHTHYPVLMPLAQVAAQELVGAGDDEPAYRTLYAAFLPVLLALVGGAVEREPGRRPPATPSSLSHLLPMVTFFPGRAERSAPTAICRWPASMAGGCCSCSRGAPISRRDGRRERSSPAPC